MAATNEAPSLVIPQLIVGLGNPGAKYENTRHNVGFMLVDALAKSWNVSLSENRKFQGIFGEGMGPTGKMRLLKPTTYMNLSGQSIRAVLDWYKLPPESVLVVYDEMDLPLGRLRMRLSGSAGGHNGMKSTISHLGTQNFPRLRIGIGRPKGDAAIEGETVSHVLGQFAKAEAPVVEEVLQLAIAATEASLKQGFEKAMSLYNSRNVETNDRSSHLNTNDRSSHPNTNDRSSHPKRQAKGEEA